MRFYVSRLPWHDTRGYAVIDANGDIVIDRYRNERSAEYHALLLNQQGAVVDHHAVPGCRIRIRY